MGSAISSRSGRHEQGTAINTRTAKVRRIPESERWDADRTLGIQAVPWSPDGSDNVHSKFKWEWRDPPPRPRRGAGGEQSGKDLSSQSRLRTMVSQ